MIYVQVVSFCIGIFFRRVSDQARIEFMLILGVENVENSQHAPSTYKIIKNLIPACSHTLLKSSIKN